VKLNHRMHSFITISLCMYCGPSSLS
jgi:hypothetical protein